MAKDFTTYNLKDALSKAVDSGKADFNETVEVHINCSLDVKKPEQSLRVTTTLPHGTGKELKVAVFSSKKAENADLELTEADLKKIEKGEIKPGTDFDILISEPQMMPKLAQVARVLGPAGVMPNPKNGTVTDDPAKAVEQFKKGKIEIRTEQSHPLIHTVIGKQEFELNKLVDNFNEVWTTIKSNKPAKAKPTWINSVYVCTSMGKSFAVDLNSI